MIFNNLKKMGINQNDQRIQKDIQNLTINENILFRNAQNGNMIIPEWEKFIKEIEKIYDEVKTNNNGKNATYIPQLANVNPDYFAVSICTIDGQILELGDTNVFFSAQSCSKPITYCIAVEEKNSTNENGEEYVHNFVGREPSGRNFNELCLNHENVPHNPMINAGSIMCVSLIDYEKPQADRYEKILKYWSKLCGNEKINFSNSTYLSEKNTADRNFCLGYMMQEKHAFQQGKDSRYKRDWTNTDLEKNLELYFQCCSIEVNCTQMAKISCTLANGGICPFTNEIVFKSDTVKNVLSLMHSCGMYDYSGEWSYLVGIASKSGVSGIIYAVIPNVMSIAVYSPRLDKIGNSVKGVEFFKKFTQRFNFHIFDSLVVNNNKKSITKQFVYHEDFNKFLLLEASSKNDIELIKKLIAQNVDINSLDYDKRSSLHVATSNRNIETVNFLLNCGVDKTIKDRWGNTAYDDAIRENISELVELLKPQ